MVDGKESWKTRQEAVEAVTDLMTRKKRVANTGTVGELMAVLKDRLAETNLNLRARVLQCIRSTAEAIGEETCHYTSLMVPELVRLCGETKQNVVDALFAALTAWVGAHALSPAIFNSMAGSLVKGLKIVKGRAGLLRWANRYANFLDYAVCSTLLSSVMDCLTSKEAAVRAEAATLMKVVCSHLSQGEVEAKIVGRPSPDMNLLHQIVDRLYAAGNVTSTSGRISDTSATTPINGPTTGPTTGPAARSSAALAPGQLGQPGQPGQFGASQAGERVTDLSQKKLSLSARPGARVLARPNPGEGMKARFQNMKSSIPKPQPLKPRKTFSEAFSGREYTSIRQSGAWSECW